MVRREVAIGNGEFDCDLPRHEDWDWVLRACEQGNELLYLDEPLVRVISSGLPAIRRMGGSARQGMGDGSARLGIGVAGGVVPRRFRPWGFRTRMAGRCQGWAARDA